MSDMKSDDLDFEYYIRSGSLVHIVRYDRNQQPKEKVALNLADLMPFHVDEFMVSFKDTLSGSIFMRFERFDGHEVTSLTTLCNNVYTTFEDGEETDCFFYDDDVDEVIAYDFKDYKVT